MRFRHAISFVLTVTCIAGSRASGQETPPRTWGTVGLGGSSLGFVSVSISGTYQTGHNLLSLRGTENSEGLFDNEYWDIGLAYGYGTVEHDYDLGIGLGIAAVGGTEGHGIFGGERTTLPIKIGLPLEARAFWHITGWLGLGVYGFANINATRSWVGATASLEIGLLR
ncbi:MAG TPA: hypothetical protein VHI13_21970 [Candidatus Kapabacteria bacterium]|nr:hypothetical protein [Candidatus Kapabacteria bacterium]